MNTSNSTKFSFLPLRETEGSLTRLEVSKRVAILPGGSGIHEMTTRIGEEAGKEKKC